mgnify:FL=1
MHLQPLVVVVAIHSLVALLKLRLSLNVTDRELQTKKLMS